MRLFWALRWPLSYQNVVAIARVIVILVQFTYDSASAGQRYLIVSQYSRASRLSWNAE